MPFACARSSRCDGRTPRCGTDEPKDVRRRLSRRHTDPSGLAPGVEHRECRHLGVWISGGLGAGTGNTSWKGEAMQATGQKTTERLAATQTANKGKSAAECDKQTAKIMEGRASGPPKPPK